MSEAPIEGRVVPPRSTKAYWVPNLANPEAPTMAELAEGVPLNYTAQMTFTRETPESHEEELRQMYRNLTLGRGWHFPYPPQEELKDRLNSWLRGDFPGEPINWKGLK